MENEAPHTFKLATDRIGPPPLRFGAVAPKPRTNAEEPRAVRAGKRLTAPRPLPPAL